MDELDTGEWRHEDGRPSRNVAKRPDGRTTTSLNDTLKGRMRKLGPI